LLLGREIGIRTRSASVHKSRIITLMSVIITLSYLIRSIRWALPEETTRPHSLVLVRLTVIISLGCWEFFSSWFQIWPHRRKIIYRLGFLWFLRLIHHQPGRNIASAITDQRLIGQVSSITRRQLGRSLWKTSSSVNRYQPRLDAGRRNFICLDRRGINWLYQLNSPLTFVSLPSSAPSRD
jgi:hypothetical protein